jgi:GNAT superfamily N-acetyltransferase
MGRLRQSAGATLRLIQGFELYRHAARRLVAQDVTICEVTDADKLAVQQWLGPDIPPKHAINWNPNVTDWVARWRGRPSGFVQLVRHPPEHSPYIGYWISGLFVKSPLQGMGIGEKLSWMVIGRACAEGSPTLDLLVFNDNDRAIHLYHKLGFEMHTITELEPQLEKEISQTGRRRVVMRKRLENNDDQRLCEGESGNAITTRRRAYRIDDGRAGQESAVLFYRARIQHDALHPS